jgi:hypothetical protein
MVAIYGAERKATHLYRLEVHGTLEVAVLHTIM